MRLSDRRSRDTGFAPSGQIPGFGIHRDTFPTFAEKKKKKSRRSAMVARRFPKAKVASSSLVGGMVSFLASGRAEGARPDENQFLMDCVWDSAVG